ncbi:YheC/YheD family protein [Litchfieldia alkalitelluris]|uniref:YheC/YheD family protein n=1 Tax=Litchfieldia alkalitelluris TaxID=304268 RepID=UPI001F206F1E|nr:YheC/YheD family protein [Litchfieldia alkalitelluris]
MILIGMLHHRQDPNTVIKSYAYAAVAKAEGVNFIYFTPGMVDSENKKINGLILENGKWKKQKSRFPDVIYNDGSPEKLAKSKEVIKELQNEGIPFTTHSIGNKWSVYQRIKASKKLVQYLIPSEIINNIGGFYHFTHAFEEVVVKPTDGRKGQGIYFIKIVDEGFKVTQDQTDRILSKKKMNRLVTSWVENGHYLIQPYISSKTKSGQVFDLRLHAQKNGEGKWVITTIYPRIAPRGTIVTNINNGGNTNYLEPFLKQEFPENHYDLKRTLEYFTIALAEHLDYLQVTHFNELIDEIGIDVGLDENQKIWIYEVNWRPGCPPAFYLELDVVTNDIQYAIYLANNKHVVNAEMEAIKKKNKNQQSKFPIVAVTGSAGKTTTKAFLASILEKRWTTFESKDYWNITDHTKKHAEELADPSYQAAVLKYGMDYPSVISEHCKIIQPNISIVTNIGIAHIANFNGEIKGIAHASELIHGMDQTGILVVNQDDENSRLLETNEFKGRIITTGIQSDAEYRAYDLKYMELGMKFKVKLHDQEYSFFIPILGEHHVYNALNAIAVADTLGLSPIDIKWGLLFSMPA